jgi:hypothetical protein
MLCFAAPAKGQDAELASRCGAAGAAVAFAAQIPDCAFIMTRDS